MDASGHQNGHGPPVENFGARMARLKREQGIPLGGPGRRPIAAKFARQLAAVERTFADALPVLAQEYTDELRAKAPEVCPDHGLVLGCPALGCGARSERTAFDHKAASYVFDRLLGKPTTRIEGTLTVRLVEQITSLFTEAFTLVNGIEDGLERRRRFAEHLMAIGERFGTS